METVISWDGTPIAFERRGQGPSIVLVDGALCHRALGPSRPLAERLAGHFTVFTYDRRGRGASGDTPPYSVDCEIEDLAAVINQAGGSARVCGVSSGAALALRAARDGLAIDKLAVYEPPFIIDDSRAPVADNYSARLTEMISADRRGDAVALFLKLVGLPAPLRFVMRVMPVWSKLKAVAPTLLYDHAIVSAHQQGRALSPTPWRDATMPTLVLVGGKSPAGMRQAMHALAGVLPNATLRTLDGHTHVVKEKAVAPVLAEFFAG